MRPPRSRWVDRSRSHLLDQLLGRSGPSSIGLAGLVGLAALVPRLLTAGHLMSWDERLWLARSEQFSQAVVSLDLGDATASPDQRLATMPGVPTMWVGTVARWIWLAGRSLSLWSSEDETFVTSVAALRISQVLMALVVSALIGLLALLVARWVGPLPAIIVGLLLASEPYLVAQGAVLHTDSLVALCGVGGLIALCLSLGIPHPTSWQGSRRAAVLAGTLLAASLLTKLSALPILLSAAMLVVWVAAPPRPRPRQAPAANEPADGTPAALPLTRPELRRVALGVSASGLALTVLLYPALWAAPLQELSSLAKTFSLAGDGHPQFFLGERTLTPGPLYVPVTIAFRSTPWFLLSAIIGLVLGWRRPYRGTTALLAVIGVPGLLVVSLASKQVARYAVGTIVVLILVVGVVFGTALSRWASNRPENDDGAAGATRPTYRRHLVALTMSLLVGVGLVAHAAVVAPWGSLYFNPALGGEGTARDVITLGSGIPLDRPGAFIAEREGQACDDRITIRVVRLRQAFPCGHLVTGTDPDQYLTYDYVVLYADERQRLDPEVVADLTEGRPLLRVDTVDGVRFIETYGPRGADG